MASFLDFFYPLPARNRSAGAVFGWWEGRRGDFNLLVGAAGCFTIAAYTLVASLPVWSGAERLPLRALLGGAALYGVLANLCYFLGPLTELAMNRLWGEEAPRAGPELYRQGLVFSVGLTLVPAVLAGIGLVVRLLSLLFG